jgi:CheY-like chemotaxis protein
VSSARYRGVVFLAEDEESVRTLAQDVLEDAGYLVLGARDGVEALARMRGVWSHAVAVIDLFMPRMDGESLIAAMRADSELASIPVIAVSGQVDRFLSAPVDRFMRKPYGPMELVEAVNALCP